MTNKLVVIIYSLKYKLQLPPETLTKGLPPPDPRSLCPQLNLLNPPEQNSWVRHWRGRGLIHQPGTGARDGRL
jgi:hypothetical protein